MNGGSCYWCGENATSDDHVIPRGFYPVGSKPARITVRSCSKHNNDLCKSDERIRVYLQGIGESKFAEDAFADKTMRGLNRPESARFKASILQNLHAGILNGEAAIYSKVEPGLVEGFSERVARGLYFHHEGKIFSGKIASFNTHIVLPNADNRAAILHIEHSIVPHLNRGTETDARVFDYWFGLVREGEAEGFIVKGCFYETAHFYMLGLSQT